MLHFSKEACIVYLVNLKLIMYLLSYHYRNVPVLYEALLTLNLSTMKL